MPRRVRISSFKFRGVGGREAECESSRVKRGRIVTVDGIRPNCSQRVNFDIYMCEIFKFRLQREPSAWLWGCVVRIVLSNNVAVDRRAGLECSHDCAEKMSLTSSSLRLCCRLAISIILQEMTEFQIVTKSTQTNVALLHALCPIEILIH